MDTCSAFVRSVDRVKHLHGGFARDPHLHSFLAIAIALGFGLGFLGLLALLCKSEQARVGTGVDTRADARTRSGIHGALNLQPDYNTTRRCSGSGNSDEMPSAMATRHLI